MKARSTPEGTGGQQGAITWPRKLLVGVVVQLNVLVFWFSLVCCNPVLLLSFCLKGQLIEKTMNLASRNFEQ